MHARDIDSLVVFPDDLARPDLRSCRIFRTRLPSIGRCRACIADDLRSSLGLLIRCSIPQRGPVSDDSIDQLLEMAHPISELAVIFSPRPCSATTSVSGVDAVEIPRDAVRAWIFPVALQSDSVSPGSVADEAAAHCGTHFRCLHEAQETIPRLLSILRSLHGVRGRNPDGQGCEEQ